MTEQIIDPINDNSAQIIEKLIAENRLDDALAAIDHALAELSSRGDSALPRGSDNAKASFLFLRGKALWRLGRKADAISSYEAAAALDPAGPASVALDQARSIMDFFHHDLLNP
ncbi:MAG: tetratricopeptide repeat protein [Bacteroidales bacterium]|nr:tetratricopeptide repeat protein [Bacteroidales bacterium]MCD8393412.1 tetratricopeptide repeat protein [Bacteroidales bacterium]